MYARWIEAIPPDERILTSVSRSTIDAIRRRYPGIPEDYLRYLSEVGAGEMGVFIVEDRPMTIEEVYGVDSVREIGRQLTIVGRYVTGETIGFDPNDNWALFVVGELMDVEATGLSFREFLYREVLPRNI